jgi:hypothetical protein
MKLSLPWWSYISATSRTEDGHYTIEMTINRWHPGFWLVFWRSAASVLFAEGLWWNPASWFLLSMAFLDVLAGDHRPEERC